MQNTQYQSALNRQTQNKQNIELFVSPESQVNPSREKEFSNQFIYCQPCFKRGMKYEPAKFVNINEFQQNRYICENCSFGQTYIIELNKYLARSSLPCVKIQNLKSLKLNQSFQSFPNQSLNKKPRMQSLQNQDADNELCINLDDKHQQNEVQEEQCVNQFAKNIQINYNDQTKYTLADIGTYTQKITQTYSQALKHIDSYEQMIKGHILRWKSKLRVQFQGVLGTFSNNIVPEFLLQLKRLQILQKRASLLELQLQQMDKQDYQQQRKNDSIQLSKMYSDATSVDKNIKYQKSIKKTPQELLQQTLKELNKQKQAIQTYVEILKMSGTRNLSNLSSLYNCCKGFSEAVKILIGLQHKQTDRRCDFISTKFKCCSIQTLYDAEMINSGLLDNKIEKPPLFQITNVIPQKSQRVENFIPNKTVFLQRNRQVNYKRQKLKGQNLIPYKQLNNYPQKAVQISLISSESQRQNASNFQQESIQQNNQFQQSLNMLDKVYQQDGIKQRNNSEQKKQYLISRIQEESYEMMEKLKMAKLRSNKPFQSELLNYNKIQRDQARQFKLTQKQSNSLQKSIQIDLQESSNNQNHHYEQQNQRNLPFAPLNEYYSYQKGRTIFQSKVQLTEQNYTHFPPPQLHLPSVQSFTVKYCPEKTQPWELLKTIKYFKRMTQLIIQEPKLATKDMLIMVAEYFPKLKSLVIKCSNQYDWEIGKLFESKIPGLVNLTITNNKYN